MTEQAQGPMSLVAMPVMDIEVAKRRRSDLVRFVKSIMVEGTDFGTIPGTAKPTLLLPGAEKLTTFFGLSNRFQCLEAVLDWMGTDHGGESFIHYAYRSRLYRGEAPIAEADGCCNSWESKYRWRWVPSHEIPLGMEKSELRQREGKTSEFAFAVKKGETTGKYGKPIEYWQRFRDAIADGSATKTTRETRAGKRLDAWEIGSRLFRIPNDDAASQVNTICKMAQKRAYTSAVKLAVNASEFFTVDIEDFVYDDPERYDNGETMEGSFAAESEPEQRAENKSESLGKTEPKPHWIDGETMRKRFWRWCKDSMVLTEDQVYDKLGVPKIHDYIGTAQDAKDCIEFCVAIEKWAQEDMALTRDQMLDGLGVGHEREFKATPGGDRLAQAQLTITAWRDEQDVPTTTVPRPEPGENPFGQEIEEAEEVLT